MKEKLLAATIIVVVFVCEVLDVTSLTLKKMLERK